jgi:hypothetical protein
MMVIAAPQKTGFSGVVSLFVSAFSLFQSSDLRSQTRAEQPTMQLPTFGQSPYWGTPSFLLWPMSAIRKRLVLCVRWH